jgi:hypothetical protein
MTLQIYKAAWASVALALWCNHLLAGTPARANRDKAPARVEPVAVARGEWGSVYAFPRCQPVTRKKLPVDKFLPEPVGGTEPEDGLALYHATAGTGEMHCLLASGPWSRPSLIQTAALHTDHGLARIVGVAADRERLYVTWWHAETQTAELDRPTGRRPELKQFGQGAYRLFVFNLKDGKILQRFDLKGTRLPKVPPEETVGRGPLQVRVDEVSCYGVTFAIKNGRLVGP